MLRKTIQGFQQVALMLARIAVGAVLVARGWYRWLVTGIDQQAAILAEAGVPAPDLSAWLVTMLELAGGVLLIFGLFTPAVGLGIIVLNVGIIVLRKLDAFYVHEHGFEYNLVLAAAGVLFLAFGSGKLGADALFFPPSSDDARKGDGPPKPAPPSKPNETTLFHRNHTGNT